MRIGCGELEGLLEKFTDIPMPFRILQEEKEEIPEPIFTHTRTTINRLYEENNQKKDPAPKNSELSELPRELLELDMIDNPWI